MEQVLSNVVDRMADYGGLVLLAVLVIFGLSWMVYFLTKRLAFLGDKMLDVIQENTAVLSKIAAKVGADESH